VGARRAPRHAGDAEDLQRDPAGAEAYLARQYKTIGMLSLVVAALLGIGYGFFRHTTANDPVQDPKTFALYVTASFLLGALSSGVAGYVGMWVSIRTNIRVAAAAMTRSTTRCRPRCAAARCRACSRWR
jgi:Na+/H+-translocating membrane pyrophosphatase